MSLLDNSYIYDLDLGDHGQQIMVNQALNQASKYIKSCQLPNGAIPWFENGKLDPWDHVEALIGLTISHDFCAVKKGFQWLECIQNIDGGWYSKYFEDVADNDLDRYKVETNFVAYVATGLWHYYLVSNDLLFVQSFYPCVKKAINYVLSQQHTEGDIQWAVSQAEDLPKDALVTACASVLRSLECAIYLAELCDDKNDVWEVAYIKLAETVKNRPWRFDRTWPSKDRFSMDWFYPILSGVYSPEESRIRLKNYWTKFVHEDLGCRCVSDEPWVTIAESCELCIALVSAGEKEKAEKLFMQLLRWQDSDGGFWTGYSYRDEVIWPLEKTSWTAAAIILAADAIFQISKASRLFTSRSCLHMP